MLILPRLTHLLFLVSLLAFGSALAGPSGPTTPGLDRTVLTGR